MSQYNDLNRAMGKGGPLKELTNIKSKSVYILGFSQIFTSIFLILNQNLRGIYCYTKFALIQTRKLGFYTIFGALAPEPKP
jgi:hypothetical protein